MNNTTNLKPFYITFGSDKKFPYPNNYMVVPADNEMDAIEKFRAKYPDRYPNTYNFSEIYTKTQWMKGISKHYDEIPAEILGVPKDAISLINAFCQEEHECDADYDNLEEIGIFYTTVDDESDDYYKDYDIPIQNNVNLIDKSIERYLEDVLIEKRTFETDEDFLWALENLEESDLVYVTEEQFAYYHLTKAITRGEKVKPTTLTISFDLEKIVKNNLIINGYQPTEYTVKETLDCLYANPFFNDGKEFLKQMIYGKIKEEIEESIAYLDKPEVQDKKGQAE